HEEPRLPDALDPRRRMGGDGRRSLSSPEGTQELSKTIGRVRETHPITIRVRFTHPITIRVRFTHPTGRSSKESTMPKKVVRSRYGVHPGVQMTRDWIASLPAKTGRSLEEWIALVRKEGPPTEKERREWLKKEHGHGTNSAWWIAERADGKGT